MTGDPNHYHRAMTATDPEEGLKEVALFMRDEVDRLHERLEDGDMDTAVYNYEKGRMDALALAYGLAHVTVMSTTGDHPEMEDR